MEGRRKHFWLHGIEKATEIKLVRVIKLEQEYISLLSSNQCIDTGKGLTDSLICLIKAIKKIKWITGQEFDQKHLPSDN